MKNTLNKKNGDLSKLACSFPCYHLPGRNGQKGTQLQITLSLVWVTISLKCNPFKFLLCLLSINYIKITFEKMQISATHWYWFGGTQTRERRETGNEYFPGPSPIISLPL